MGVVNDRTPIIIGVGQMAERPDDADYRALRLADLCAEAARRAVADAGGSGVAEAIDTVVGIRQFENGYPGAVAPFGRPDNLPRAIAQRIGASPARAVMEPGGGERPQKLVGEFAVAIAEGTSDMVLLFGGEVISTILHLTAKGEPQDWNETVEGSLEDRGYGFEDFEYISPLSGNYNLQTPVSVFSLLENARRAADGTSEEDYRAEMAALLAPLSRVAERNPYAAAPVAKSAEELATVTERNRMIADPYTRMMVARDQVNQSAAVLMTSVGRARALGIPEEKWVYLHGHAEAADVSVLSRPDFGRNDVGQRASAAALDIADKQVADMASFDIYSCFPIAVSSTISGLGLSADDPRGLTTVGGLPFFGGAGNNYSMHAVCEAVERSRAARGSHHLVCAIGGFLSKSDVGIYSTEPADWSAGVRSTLLEKPTEMIPLDKRFEGEAMVETYALVHGKRPYAVVIAREQGSDRRVLAVPADEGVLAQVGEAMPIGRRITVSAGEGKQNLFRF